MGVNRFSDSGLVASGVSRIQLLGLWEGVGENAPAHAGCYKDRRLHFAGPNADVELMNAIKTVSAGKTFFSPRVTSIMMESLLPKKGSGTDREDIPLGKQPIAIGKGENSNDHGSTPLTITLSEAAPYGGFI